MIILIGGEKGGTGKTTLATNIAALRAQQGYDVLLVDTDKQESANFWVSTRDESGIKPRISCIQKYGQGVVALLKDLTQRYSEIIVDAGGRDSVELRAAMVVANRLIVPVQASQFDIWTLTRMDDLIQQAQAINENLEAYITINRASTNPSVKETDEAREILSDFPSLSFSGTTICDRIAFRKAATSGLAVNELSHRDTKAIAEIANLYNCIYAQETKHEESTSI